MIPLSRPSILRADMDAVLTRMAHDSIGAGSVAREFAQTFARYVGRRGGVPFRSYGDALSAAICSLQLEPQTGIGLSVLMPKSAGHIVEHLGFRPVFLDTAAGVPILPSPLEVDFTKYRLSALIVDTRLGFVADLEHMSGLRVPLIEDISEGLGANTGERMVGSYAEVTVCDLEPTSLITVGGGAVVLSNSTRRLSILNDETDSSRGNLPLPDMNAALGLTQLKQIEWFLERRVQVATRLAQAVLRSGHRLIGQPDDASNVSFCLPVYVSSTIPEIERYTRQHGVAVQSVIRGTILEELREQRESEYVLSEFPRAVELVAHAVMFPVFPMLSNAELQQLEKTLASLP